jgi:hypothetical protein
LRLCRDCTGSARIGVSLKINSALDERGPLDSHCGWKILIVAAILVATASQSQASQSQASQIFDFSLQNDPTINNPPIVGVPGTVTGKIVLSLNGDGTGAASSVLIGSYPNDLNGIAQFPTDAITWNDYSLANGFVPNSFTVSNGQITSAQFLSLDETPVGNPTLFGELAINASGVTNALFFQNNLPTPQYLSTENAGGLAGVSFAPAATPEPATITLLASGLFAAGWLGLYRRRRAATAI